MIIAQNLCLRLGSKVIFDDVSFNFDKNSHVALVGRNGTGKTTLLNVIAGTQSIDSGSLSLQKGASIAYMPQEEVLASPKSILEETISAVGDIDALKKQMRHLEQLFEKPDHTVTQQEITDYATLQEKLADLNLDSVRVQAELLLCGLGFMSRQLNQPVAALSVGWKMRVVLAKLLLQKADFYLFDEPTNHLDIVAKDWFVEFLQQAHFGFLLVSHDRFFLDNSCEKTYSLDRGKGRLYHGNYSFFLKQQEEERERLEKAYIVQQKELQRKKATIERFRASASKAKMAKSMEKSLEKVEVIELEHDQKGMQFSFPDVERSGEVVLKVDDLRKSFDGNMIFQHASFELKRGEKAAIVAPNGKGKTTLFNLIAGKYPNEGGTINFGYNVSWALFEQDQAKVLNPNKTILQEVEDACRTAEARQRVRGLLGAFLFPGEDAYKKTSVLSGGEKNRVAMVKVLLQKANLLLLDEPTNHLDLQSKEILLKALQEFPGTILFVSHDRFFLDELATCIFALSADGIVTCRGNYESYLYQKKVQEEGGAVSSGQLHQKKNHHQAEASPIKKGKDHYEIAKKLRKLEEKIERYEKERDQLYQEFEDVSYKADEFEVKNNRLNELLSLLDEAYQEWEELST